MPTAFIAIDFFNDILHPSGKDFYVAKHVEQRAGLSRVIRLDKASLAPERA